MNGPHVLLLLQIVLESEPATRAHFVINFQTVPHIILDSIQAHFYHSDLHYSCSLWSAVL